MARTITVTGSSMKPARPRRTSSARNAVTREADQAARPWSGGDAAASSRRSAGNSPAISPDGRDVAYVAGTIGAVGNNARGVVGVGGAERRQEHGVEIPRHQGRRLRLALGLAADKDVAQR